MSSRSLAVLVTAALALGACTPADDDEVPHDGPVTATTGAAPDRTSDAGPVYARYVALGDSFAALGPTAAPTSGPARCMRSTRNYASLLAERPEVGELVDVTCGGAETPDLTAPQNPGTPAQFDALTGDTDLVTLSIGGNDIGFGTMVGCIVQTPRVEIGAPCRDQLEIAVTGELDGLGERLDRVYSGIRERSPDARIVTTAYLPLVPDHGTCEFVSGMSPGDVTWIRHVTERINMIVADAAERAGADVVMPTDADERHACAPATHRYTDFTGAQTGSHPMHPTAAGHLAMAEAVGAVL
ncbi:SGNH/GDSL hydrolase family protein [Dietzia sp. PP-33]|uniref:SGNH/GDSL hydrolase family protein n=1 Tax=Dietzia sp. PP-33 TaxID=2957500 RepID=UPI0029A9F97E|nr:SGNH/GDSL hydrolase family protein [Dietzia sp. PP-33]MDX2358103.1 SGNH/GDSL hydrolase family protein [Dietzia sp. PP-33]